MSHRSIAEEIMLYGTLLGLGETECEQMAHTGTQQARIDCMEDLRRRYREENAVPESEQRIGLEQVEFWKAAPVKDFVYFLQSGLGGPVKIGRSVDPLERMGDLQTGNPEELHLRHVVPGDRSLERDLHHRFREARIRREWFGLHYLAIILTYAEGLAAQHIEHYEREGGVPMVVAGGSKVMSAHDRGEMHRDLASLFQRFEKEEAYEIAGETYGLDENEIAAELKAAAIQPAVLYHEHRKRSYRLAEHTKPA